MALRMALNTRRRVAVGFTAALLIVAGNVSSESGAAPPAAELPQDQDVSDDHDHGADDDHDGADDDHDDGAPVRADRDVPTRSIRTRARGIARL